MVDVEKIRFTQEHVYDSFNANDKRAMNVVDLIGCILRGEKTPLDLPLIRVAVKKGAYWCVDNRRLFVYKHCQLGEIPVTVCGWKDNREFELKWKNGLAVRADTSGGRRIGILQRTGLPFPRSLVAEPKLSQVRYYLEAAEQTAHDAAIAALREKRSKDSASKVSQSLLEVLQPMSAASSSKPTLKRKKKRRAEDASIASPTETLATGTPVAQRRLKKKRRKAVEAKPASNTAVTSSANGGGTTLNVTMDGEDSGSDDYAVEVFAPS